MLWAYECVRSPRADGTATAPPSALPWTAEDLVRWLAAAAFSAVIVVVAWYLAAGQASDMHQVGPLDLAIGGVVLGGIANLMWLLRGWQAVGERRKALIARLPIDVPASAAAGAVEAETAPLGVGLLVGEGVRYFHRPSCPLTVGRNWPPAPLDEHLRAGREPCGMCKP